MAIKPGSLQTPAFAAIDAGSNAIRLLIARAEGPSAYERIYTERMAVRLGHHVFTHHEFDPQTIDEAVEVFRHFKAQMDRHEVTAYRAVATSATREAGNRKTLIKRLQKEADLKLEVIDGVEEARLVRLAVLSIFGEKVQPRLICDLGGGSLELTFLKKGLVEQSYTLPIGTVRLMEHFGVEGAISEELAENIRGNVQSLLKAHLPDKLEVGGQMVAACGGNAEQLAQIAGGEQQFGKPTLDLFRLHEKLWSILSLNISERMEAFHVRRDRAEVMGVAAIVFATLGRFLGVNNMSIPGVGVREGTMWELVRTHYGTAPTNKSGYSPEALRQSCRDYAQKFHYESGHAEQVRRLSLSLFDQLKPIHKLGIDARLTLELAAILHDIGTFIHRQKHPKHGEYLIVNGAIKGLNPEMRDMIAVLVRHHSKGPMKLDSRQYDGLSEEGKTELQMLTAILRTADGLDYDHGQLVKDLTITPGPKKIDITLQAKMEGRLNITHAQEKALLLEELTGRKVFLKSVRG